MPSGWIMYGEGTSGSPQILTPQIALKAIDLLRSVSDVHRDRDFPRPLTRWGDKCVAKSKIPAGGKLFMKMACHYGDLGRAGTGVLGTMDTVVLFQRIRKEYPPPHGYDGIWVFTLAFDESKASPLPDFDPTNVASAVIDAYLGFIGTRAISGNPARPGVLDPVFDWHWTDVPGDKGTLYTIGDKPMIGGSSPLNRKVQLLEQIAQQPESKWILSDSEDIPAYGSPKPGGDTSHYWGGRSGAMLRIYKIAVRT